MAPCLRALLFLIICMRFGFASSKNDHDDHCSAAIQAQSSGNNNDALKLWQIELQKERPCRYAQSLYALALVRSGQAHQLEEGVNALQAVVRRDPSDWVATSYLAASFELMARRIEAKKDEQRQDTSPTSTEKQSRAYRTALESAAQLFSSAHKHREKWRALPDQERAAYLPARFAQPATYMYRSWGQVLLWLGREAEARAAFQAGVDADTGWVSPLVRPSVPLRLAFPQPRPFFTADDYPESLGPLLHALEASLPAIRQEYLSLRGQQQEHIPHGGGSFVAESAGLHAHSLGRWSVLLLTLNGAPDSKGCALAPVTCGILTAPSPPALALARSVGDGQAKFSVLGPGTHIKPHAGPANARLRLHCTLTLMHGGPETASFRVGTEVVHWQDGRCFVFDESFEHEVTTASQQVVDAHASQSPGGPLRANERAVLLVDIANPFLASYDDFRAHALSRDSTADKKTRDDQATDRALRSAWEAAQREAGGSRSRRLQSAGELSMTEYIFSAGARDLECYSIRILDTRQDMATGSKVFPLSGVSNSVRC